MKRRIDALLAHLHGGGAEAENAKRALAVLVARHPEWAWVLDPGAAAPAREAVDAPAAPHRTLLDVLARRHACEITIEEVGGEGVPMGRYFVEGRSGKVAALLSEYGPHADRLSLLLEVVGFAFVRTIFPDDDGAAEAEAEGDDADAAVRRAAEAEAEEGMEDGESPGLGRFEAYEATRIDRLGEAATGLPMAKIGDVAKRMAEMATPDKSPPVVALLGGVVKAWDAEDMTFPEFVAFYRASRPVGGFSDMDLRFRFRAGERLYPPTGRLRKVPGREIPWDQPLPGDEDEEAGKPARRRKRRKT